MAQQQKIMLYVFPLVFLFYGFKFPIGVLLYWLTTNVWSMAQQRFVIRRMDSRRPCGRQRPRRPPGPRPARNRSRARRSVEGDAGQGPEPGPPSRRDESGTPPKSGTPIPSQVDTAGHRQWRVEQQRYIRINHPKPGQKSVRDRLVPGRPPVAPETATDEDDDDHGHDRFRPAGLRHRCSLRG